MSCAEVDVLLPEMAGGELAGEREADVRKHVEHCPACARRLAELTATVGLLRRAGDAPLPSGFQAELHFKLVASAPLGPSLGQRLRDWLALRPFAFAASAAALSALVAVGGTLAILEQRGASPHAVQAGFRVPEAKVALVKIDFVSGKEIDDVSFEILLPDGLHFYSGGHELAERSFQWQGKLSTGSNLVPVAVKGSRPGLYHVIAHATGDNLDVSQDVILEVTS
jgi:hypothetical protein